MFSKEHFLLILLIIISIIDLNRGVNKNGKVKSQKVTNPNYYHTLNYEISHAYDQVFQEIQENEKFSARRFEPRSNLPKDIGKDQVPDWIKTIQTHPVLRSKSSILYHKPLIDKK
jgi:hypothetical protein